MAELVKLLRLRKLFVRITNLSLYSELILIVKSGFSFLSVLRLCNKSEYVSKQLSAAVLSRTHKVAMYGQYVSGLTALFCFIKYSEVI